MIDQVNDTTAETATISVCLESSIARKEARRHLNGDDFWRPEHEAIWEAMSRLDRAKRTVDPTSVRIELGGDQAAISALIAMMGDRYAIPENVGHYAEAVRGWSVRRRLIAAAEEVRRSATNPDIDATGLASATAARFAAVRDAGSSEDIQSITLAELLAAPDDEPDWVVPGLLEHRDRLILTGGEGLGKAHCSDRSPFWRRRG